MVYPAAIGSVAGDGEIAMHDAKRRTPPGQVVDRGSGSSAPAPGRRTLVQQIEASHPPVTGAGRSTASASSRAVQRKPGGAPAPAPAADPSAIAMRGLQGAAAPLPHLDRIQALFGRHDVSGVRAQIGDGAATACAGLGAKAFAFGSEVGFAAAPDLHTAAHEAAHVVQQRAGVHLAGGIGAAGDAHEQHADAVADRVIAGASAVDLLDRYAPDHGVGAGASGARAVQCVGADVVERLRNYFGWLGAGAAAALADLAQLGRGDRADALAQLGDEWLSKLLAKLENAHKAGDKFEALLLVMTNEQIVQHAARLILPTSSLNLNVTMMVLAGLPPLRCLAAFEAIGAAAVDPLVANCGGEEQRRRQLQLFLEQCPPTALTTRFLPLLSLASAKLCMTLRFGVQAGPSSLPASPDLDLPGLIRSWTVMAQLPAQHTTDNPEFQRLGRTSATGGGSQGGQEVRFGYRTDKIGQRTVRAGDYAQPGDPVVGWNDFDHTLRHEIGHAVDAAIGASQNYFSGHGPMWRRENPEAVVLQLFSQHRLDDLLPPQLVPGVVKALAEVSRNPAAWAGGIDKVFDVLDMHSSMKPQGYDDNKANPEDAQLYTNTQGWRTLDPKWKASLRDHPAIVALMAACDETWTHDDGGAGKGLLAGGRIYQSDVASGGWVSYVQTARDHKVSKYQFKAPSEWFAEAYAAFYEPAPQLGAALQAVDQPTHAWFVQNVHDKRAPVPQAQQLQQAAAQGEDD